MSLEYVTAFEHVLKTTITLKAICFESKDSMPDKVFPLCGKKGGRKSESGITIQFDLRGLWWSCRRDLLQKLNLELEGELVLVRLCVF